MNNETTPPNLGAVVSVRGSVVDIQFDAMLPPTYPFLSAPKNCSVDVSSSTLETLVLSIGAEEENYPCVRHS